MFSGQVLTLDQVAALRAALRRAGRRVVATNGCFDLLHVGHARLLRHGFDFTLHTLASHPLGRTLGLSSQTVPFGLEVTGQFVLASA